MEYHSVAIFLWVKVDMVAESLADETPYHIRADNNWSVLCIGSQECLIERICTDII